MASKDPQDGSMGSYNRHKTSREATERPHKRRRTETDNSGHGRNLPFGAGTISKHDLKNYMGLFGLYLDLQKQIYIEDLDEQELKGRWKSFLGKWNRGELSEGYYDPATKAKADTSRSSEGRVTSVEKAVVTTSPDAENSESDGGGDYGPALPQGSTQGAAIANRQDLQYRDELVEEAKRTGRESIRHERKMERKLQKDRMDEVAPRAEPGTKDRLLEKKREKLEANRSFRESKDGGVEEVGDKDLLGDEGAEAYKAQLKEHERRKTEREVRKEEVLRARAAEREERLAAHRAKENKTLDMLKEIAKQRFG
ncbi:hypothetical protein CAC42_2686 [Sphaceloma murrayae]|uniref:Uncharacterized protein n=1 Tax=Sphaceloma murrayae TaxID=2082308 RepID=A0A2K1R0C2_9PEZI|nr:hypothetical protein CAC42_2686 [Sphaceloma murrayae]